jgi:citrate/tricarballylate utilization protein
MGVLLAPHLGIVLALFVTPPYGKLVHGLHRAAALLKYRAHVEHRASGVDDG